MRPVFIGVARNVGNVAATLQGVPGSKDVAPLASQLAGFTMYPVNPEKARGAAVYRQQQEYADYLNRLEERGMRPPTPCPALTKRRYLPDLVFS